MSYSCFIVDDEQHAIDVLVDYINDTAGLSLLGTETNPVKALNLISSGELNPDITFLDIDLPKLSGIKLNELIKDKTKVIFTTAFKDYAVEAFDVNALDFLLKPIEYQRFLQAVDKVYASTKKEGNNSWNQDKYLFFLVDNKKNIIKLNIDEIIRIEGLSNYVKISTTTDQEHIVYISMKEILNKLPKQDFIRSHKSHIVSFKYIDAINGNVVKMKGSINVPIGSLYKKDLLARITGVG